MWERMRLFRMRRWLDGIYVHPAFTEIVLTTFLCHGDDFFDDESKKDYLLEQAESVIIEREQRKILSLAEAAYI